MTQTVSDVQSPSGATPAPAGVAAPAQPIAPATPISPEQASFLRARRDALSSQLRSVQRRRDDVAERLRKDDTQAVERPGLQERLNVLDQRLIQIEQEIAANSEQLANAPPEAGSEGRIAVAGMPAATGFEGFMQRANPNTVFFFSFLLLMPVVVHLSRRFLAPKKGPGERELAELAALKERMERMDSAIDAVAVEVERIGEGQRFLTQAMTENFQRPAVALGAPAFEPVPVRQRDVSERR